MAWKAGGLSKSVVMSWIDGSRCARRSQASGMATGQRDDQRQHRDDRAHPLAAAIAGQGPSRWRSATRRDRCIRPSHDLVGGCERRAEPIQAGRTQHDQSTRGETEGDQRDERHEANAVREAA